VYGEVLFDHFPDGARVLGGAPFNVAWHLCGFGSDPVLVSAVGTDTEGGEILDRMSGWGLSTVGVSTLTRHPTGRVVVSIADDEPSYDIPANQAWDRIPVPELGAGTAGLVYHGTLALREPESLRRLLELRAQLSAMAFVDLNLRAPWWTADLVQRCIQGVEWAKLSADELAQITGLPATTPEECEKAAAQLQTDHDIAHVLVTRGKEGSILLARGEPTLRTEAVDGGHIVDTVGAGDAFSAVVCHGILQRWKPAVTLERAGAFALDICRIRGATSSDLSLYERHLRRWAEMPAPTGRARGLNIVTLSIHGLVRASDIELGRDADTGGQVSYVVDQARALADHPDVDRVTLVTRLVSDSRVPDSYAEPVEEIGPGAYIVRLPFGPRRYLRKETLWPYLDELLDQLARWVRTRTDPPDIIHGHYADAGYVGAQLSKLLGVPFVFTGHSLGRVKRARLLADGMTEEAIEDRYRISRRIEAEEQALEAADIVIASTRQEVREQFEDYDHYAPHRMRVIPPGVDLTRFSPPPPLWQEPPFIRDLARFLVDPDRPLILALARPDERKNFPRLLQAFAETSGLRERTNLAVVAGTRDDIREMSPEPRRVLTEILLLVDTYDLYGSVAYPKRHRPEDVPDLYRYAAHTKGVFVNPALTEPFGLTLLEAAATGLPVVATNDGGPRDILDQCEHGLLADPLDSHSLGSALLEALSSDERWGRWSKNGVSRVHERFSWPSHAREYVEEVKHALTGTRRHAAIGEPTHLQGIDRLVVTDVDETLTGDEPALEALMQGIRQAGERVGFGIATSRSLEPTLELLDELGVETPDVLVTASGAEIRYGRRLVHDRSWERQIRHRWDPQAIRHALAPLPGLSIDEAQTSEYRLRYRIDPETAPSPSDLRTRLRQAGVQATAIFDRDAGLDVLPVRASPGLALRFFGFKWNLEPSRILVAGDSGNDRDMLEGETLGVVVGNHTHELESLRDRPRVYFAAGEHAWGVLEGIAHYDFFGEIKTEDDHPDAR
jgi:sucrose-phosphate synthase